MQLIDRHSLCGLYIAALIFLFNQHFVRMMCVHVYTHHVYHETKLFCKLFPFHLMKFRINALHFLITFTITMTPPSQQSRPTMLPDSRTRSPSPKRMRPDTMKRESHQSEELSRGAEGVITRLTYLGREAVRKQRFAKSYRHPALDSKITLQRIQQEARILLRLRTVGVRVPAIYNLDLITSTLILEFVQGITLKAFLYEQPLRKCREPMMEQVGNVVARMHKADVIHGDLTTSNIMVSQLKNEQQAIWMIDFGLSSVGCSEEDLAVDLYVFERAMISAHPEAAQHLNAVFLDAYAKELARPAVLERLTEVRQRGRKRNMTG